MSATPILDALSRIERQLFTTDALESFRARREAGEPDPDDAGLCEALADELIAHQSDNGSWGDSLTHTVESARLLQELRPLSEAYERALLHATSWIRSTGLSSPGRVTFAFEPKSSASFVEVRDDLFESRGALSNDLIVLDALVLIGHESVEANLRRLMALQRADGTWPGADISHVVDTLLHACHAGYETPAAKAAIARSAEMLSIWSGTPNSFQLLTTWRALRYTS